MTSPICAISTVIGSARWLLVLLVMTGCQSRPLANIATVDAGAAAQIPTVVGTYRGTLPCADCPGIEVTLTLYADGRFQRRSLYQERGSSFDESGRWSLDAASGKIHLDTETDDDADGWMQRVDANELRMLDNDGNRIDSTLNYSLRRIAP